MSKTKEELIKRLDESPFDFYLDDDSMIDEESIWNSGDLEFIKAYAVTVSSEWFSEPVEGEELATIDDESEVLAFLNNLESEGYEFRVDYRSWDNEDREYSVTALMVIPE